MSFRDIAGLVVCGGFYILPFAIIIGFALSRLYKSIIWRRKCKLSNRLEKNCEGCMHLYFGSDYVHHCDISEKIGPTICNPKSKWCYRKKV